MKEKDSTKPKRIRFVIWGLTVVIGVLAFIGLTHDFSSPNTQVNAASIPKATPAPTPSAPPLRPFTNISWFDNPEEQRCWLRILNDQKRAITREDGTSRQLQFGNGLLTHLCWCWGLVVREFNPEANWDGERTANGTYVFQGRESFNMNNLLIVDPAHFVAHYDYKTDTTSTVNFEGTFSYRNNERATYVFGDAGSFSTITADGTSILRDEEGEWDMKSFEEEFEIWTMLLNAFQTQTARVAAVMLPWERNLQDRVANRSTRLPISNFSSIGQLGYNWELLLTTPQLRSITETEHPRGFHTLVNGLNIHLCWCYGIAVNRYNTDLDLNGQTLSGGIRVYKLENKDLLFIEPSRFVAYHNYAEGYTITLGEDGTISIRTNGGRQGYYFYGAGGVVGSTTTNNFVRIVTRDGIWDYDTMFAHEELDWIWAINRKHSFMSHILGQMLPWNSEAPW